MRAQVAQTLRGLQEKLNVAYVKTRVFQATQEGRIWDEKPWRSEFSDPASTQTVVTNKKVTPMSSSSFIQCVSPQTVITIANQDLQARQSRESWPFSGHCQTVVIPVDEEIITG